ncbi:hypothetical protein [Sporosarcina sp. FSL K6-5500]|uniref:hypothetical protein n=1 Tax=Sporosarcina sp. FSL K6-5500 TaxID=2921558 RepID=UPI0030F7AABA
MKTDKFFETLEDHVQEVEGKQIPETLNMTITYSTGEKDVFKATHVFWANLLIACKNRKKYSLYKNRLINLDHVVKVEFEDLDCEQHASK